MLDSSGLASAEGATSWIVRQGTGELRLLAAMLERAVLDLYSNDFSAWTSSRRWILAPESDKGGDEFSFNWVINTLALPPDTGDNIRLAARFAPIPEKILMGRLERCGIEF